LSKDVHDLSYRLHPSVLDDLGLAEGLRAECGQVSRHAAIAVTVDVDGVPAKLPREPSLCLFRVAQEALRNVVRHAQASAISVSLSPQGRGLQLTVRDDGRGFEAIRDDQPPSLGQMSMRERVRQAGGRLRIDSAPGTGTTVTAWVPLERATT
jgi:signal transduction histidine kinase